MNCPGGEKSGEPSSQGDGDFESLPKTEIGGGGLSFARSLSGKDLRVPCPRQVGGPPTWLVVGGSGRLEP